MSYDDDVSNEQDVSPGVNALDLLYDDEDDYEDYDDEDEQEQIGGDDKDSENEEYKLKNFVKTSLKRPNPFSEYMHAMEPSLFLVKDQGKYERYSRLCDFSYGRLPILLTKSEFQENLKIEKRIV